MTNSSRAFFWDDDRQMAPSQSQSEQDDHTGSVCATLTITPPPGLLAPLLRDLRTIAAPIRVEPGCLACKVFEDVDDRGSLTLWERWLSLADFQRHLRTARYRQILQLLELSTRDPRLQFHLVSRTLGMEAIRIAHKGDESDS